jgi:hypothetical protein
MYNWMLRCALICAAGAALGTSARAEIISLAGFAQAQVTEYYLNEARDSDSASDAYPETAAELPLQVVAHLVSPEARAGDPNEAAAASVGAQLADPTTVTSPNPEEFAINLALHSISPHIRYVAAATSRETRGVRYAPGELSLFSADGDAVTLTGRLFLDGALTIFANQTGRDLAGVYARLIVTVVKRVEGLDDVTVFSGQVELAGTADGTVAVNVEGDFPTNRLVLTDFSGTSFLFDVFRVLVLPNLTIDYPFDAVVGQDFTLAASVSVEAANLPDETGVAVILGTPTDTLIQVIGLTNDAQTASEFVSKLNTERANPTGDLVYPTAKNWPFLPACGLFGFESILGLLALAGFGRAAGRSLVKRK